MKGELRYEEPHPSAYSALQFVLDHLDWCSWAEVFASAELADNRIATILGETLRRVLTGESVSDRYILGLAWHMRGAIEYTEGRASVARHTLVQEPFVATARATAEAAP